MYFYIDESGHTGPNLFDRQQPMLYYGVVSSKLNVDLLAESKLKNLKNKLGFPRLHAAEMGNGRLASIAKDLQQLQKDLDIRFDCYRVNKSDHAIISFFDQVFDQGLNPAITWTGYWTPMRYVLLIKLAALFDEPLAVRAWNARIDLDTERSAEELAGVCVELRNRVGILPDARSQQLISDALQWAEQNPSEIHYNVYSRNDRLQVMPNLIGFQSVMHGIASRVMKNGRKASKIVVDQQTQFNKAQRSLAEFYASAKGIPVANGPGLPKIDFTSMPTIPIIFSSSTTSAGLQLVDIYLWIMKRMLDRKEIAPELIEFIKPQFARGIGDEISLRSIEARWSKWFEELPEPSEEQMVKAAEVLAVDEERRLEAVKGLRRVAP